MTPGPDDCDRIADEVVLMLLSRDTAELFWGDLTHELRKARARIAARYCELKGAYPFAESERRAKAEVVADWLRRRMGPRPEEGGPA
jgi:hypothetical protein